MMSRGGRAGHSCLQSEGSCRLSYFMFPFKLIPDAGQGGIRYDNGTIFASQSSGPSVLPSLYTGLMSTFFQMLLQTIQEWSKDI